MSSNRGCVVVVMLGRRTNGRVVVVVMLGRRKQTGRRVVVILSKSEHMTERVILLYEDLLGINLMKMEAVKKRSNKSGSEIETTKATHSNLRDSLLNRYLRLKRRFKQIIAMRIH
ncbi:hypothetical protein YC2023_075014 [Brassica napus]